MSISYGDLIPTEHCRWFAAAEALLGYFFLALSAAVFFSYVLSENIKKDLAETKKDLAEATFYHAVLQYMQADVRRFLKEKREAKKRSATERRRKKK